MSLFSFKAMRLVIGLLVGVLALGHANHAWATQIVGPGGKCLTVRDGRAVNGTDVVVWECQPGTASQDWRMGDGRIIAFGGKCLDLRDGNMSNGAHLQIWDCFPGNTNQHWDLSGGQIFAYGHKCMDLPGGRAFNGNYIQVWDCDSRNPNQHWSLQYDISAQDGTPTPSVAGAPPTVTHGNEKPAESSKGLPTDESSNAEIDAGFRRWSAGWMFDRYVPGSARATERALKKDTYVIRGMFDFMRGGGRLSIPYAASYSKADDRYLLSNLCYNDISTGMTDCVNPRNPGPMQNRQFLGSIVLLGMVAAMASDQTCVKRYTFFGSSYLECYD